MLCLTAPITPEREPIALSFRIDESDLVDSLSQEEAEALMKAILARWPELTEETAA